MSRYSLFLIAIGIGLGLGLLFGWVISPVEFVDTSPDMLRQDYKADYVLMIAESYKHERDIELAAQRLAILAEESPTTSVKDATVFAVMIEYSPSDLVLLRELAEDLHSWNPDWE